MNPPQPAPAAPPTPAGGGDPLPVGIRSRFAAPQHAGALPGPGPGMGPGGYEELRQGEAGEAAQGTWIRLQLGLRGGRVAAARFLAYGCPWTVAACDWLAERLEGSTPPAPGGPSPLGGPLDWARELGVPEARLTRLLVLEDALRAAWQSPEPAAG